MTTEAKCPFDHSKAAAPKGRGNADWWPNQLNLRPSTKARHWSTPWATGSTTPRSSRASISPP